MVTVIIISGGPATGDPDPTVAELAADLLREQGSEPDPEQLEDQAKPWPRERRVNDWPKLLSVLICDLFGWPGPRRVSEVCGRYPSGFK